MDKFIHRNVQAITFYRQHIQFIQKMFEWMSPWIDSFSNGITVRGKSYFWVFVRREREGIETDWVEILSYGSKKITWVSRSSRLFDSLIGSRETKRIYDVKSALFIFRLAFCNLKPAINSIVLLLSFLTHHTASHYSLPHSWPFSFP